MPLAEDAELRIRQLDVCEPEIKGLARAETIQQHQGNQGEISKATKATPELGHLLGGEWHYDASCLFEPESGSNNTMGTAVAERRLGLVGTLEERVICGQGVPGMEAIQRLEHA